MLEVQRIRVMKKLIYQYKKIIIKVNIKKIKIKENQILNQEGKINIRKIKKIKNNYHLKKINYIEIIQLLIIHINHHIDKVKLNNINHIDKINSIDNQLKLIQLLLNSTLKILIKYYLI